MEEWKMEKKNKILYCNTCDNTFSTNHIKFKNKTINKSEGVKIQYFKCPVCDQQYVTFISDPYLRELMKRYEENKKKYNKLLKRKASEFEIRYSLEHLNRDFNRMMDYEQGLMVRYGGK